MGNSTSNTKNKPRSAVAEYNFVASCNRNEVHAVYQGIYTLSESYGIVKITQLIPNSCSGIKDVDVDIVRHNERNKIIVEGLLDKSIYQKTDESYVEQKHSSSVGFFNNNNKTWLPWWDDGVTNKYGDTRQCKSYRGGNRLHIDIREPGTYRIFIPMNYDFTVNTLKMASIGKGIRIAENNSNYSVEVLDQDKENVYNAQYIFSKPKGFIRIVSDADSTDINIKRNNNKTNIFTLSATINKTNIDSSIYTNSVLPWTDTRELGTNHKDLAFNTFIRGGNRIDIALKKPGIYQLNVPNDIDLVVDILKGDIYMSGDTGEKYINATDVSKTGYTGSIVAGYNSWIYSGSKEAGFSDLTTKKGHAYF